MGLWRSLRAFGWLPVGQGIGLVISTVGFAVLARTLGARPFAEFSTALFVFTVVSLSLDLSPQGFVLVHGDSTAVRSSAKQAAVISSLASFVLVFAMTQVANEVLLRRSLSVYVSLALALAAPLQFMAQIPRARLLLARRYRSTSIVDLVATGISVAVAIATSLRLTSSLPLALQLLTMTLARAVLLTGIAKRSFPSDGPAVALPPDGASAIRYGLRVLPLNVAAYLGRSLDSGILPAFIPATAAAAYSRSYQLVVTPISQVQSSLGPAIIENFARSQREGRTNGRERTVWYLGLAGSATVASLIAVSSGLLSAILFGPRWPQAQAFIAGMASILPGMAITTFLSWKLQLRASAPNSLRHLAAQMVTPVTVIVSGAILGPQAAVATLVMVGGIVNPILVMLANRPMLMGISSLRRAYLSVLLAWSMPALIFVAVSWRCGFWGFSAW
ncbi:MAG: oligosaccharide flippase family protein [Phycicoccus sp.]|nr:oligosaccharide flippase family protein [Phycicoccus sp.]